ncbi:MAG: DUF177 domain-containing protein [Comamonadaceae bacterium]|nr:MAG: DUF177 domain-containing protein [Comamonadaceae bacterium]
MSKGFAVGRLDVRAFAEQGGRLAGEDTVVAHERLAAETRGRDGDRAVTWSVRGEMRNRGHHQPEIWLHLQARTVLSLICQRCLAPVLVPVVVERPFRFVADEQTAAAEDDESDEDVLALSNGFDVMELIEDELLMELPVAPRHDVCPEPVKSVAADPEFGQVSEERQSPFALLEKLRANKN